LHGSTREDQVGGTDLADLPDVNELVDVMLDSRTEPHGAVVSAVSSDAVVLKEPYDRTGRIVLPDIGEGGLLVWGQGSSLSQVPIEVLEINRKPAPTWVVRLTGAPGRCQRRSFVRADVLLPVVVRHPDGDLELTAIDLSEGGMRCNTREETTIKVGDSVTADFTAERPLTMQATVTRVLRGDEERPTDLGLSFVNSSIADADSIRRYVFSQLLEQRRRGAA
jgi:hypothetical protein